MIFLKMEATSLCFETTSPITRDFVCRHLIAWPQTEMVYGSNSVIFMTMAAI